MKTNHRRRVKSRQEYPYDLRGWKVPDFRFFRGKEQNALYQIRAGIDPDDVIFPYRRCENDDVWNYD